MPVARVTPLDALRAEVEHALDAALPLEIGRAHV